MHVEFVGAAGGNVTGSRHLVHTEHATILLDCGLFQGRRKDTYERNRDLGFRASDVDVMVLSHAHIDHSGALPRLYRQGFRGPIYCTPATRDLCAVMLEDSAEIQRQDAAYINRAIERDHADMEPVEPLYTQDDVVGTLGLMVNVPYHREIVIAEGVKLTYCDAGHVLGSAMVALDIDVVGEERRLVFSGDIGRRHMPILRDPEIPPRATYLLMESTYGDRNHDPIERMEDELHDVISRTVDRGGKVIVPSFALERAQEVIYALKDLKNQGRLPDVPVYVDSPLTVKVTDVFRMHPNCFDRRARELVLSGDSPFDFEGLKYVSSVEDSKAIDRSDDPAVIISASGMCEFGRVVHHLVASIENRKNTVMIVGFQAQHTLGRRLVERRSRVRIFGVERDRHAEVAVLNGFSAHAGQDDLIDYAERVREAGSLRTVALVHGEDEPRNTLKELLEARGFPSVLTPKRGDRLRL
ncbi:MAG: MBL fold metallo-hydrolase [Myxococcales bacterium]|nr:MBL fold metallo-hydrolase [Myxococcales bacterium]MDH3843066.1 MBL fold metallo-hydrolase [Myxococcales bacterium]